jgi:hypothetical protein
MNPIDPPPEGQDLVIATLTAAGKSSPFIASELGVSVSTVKRARARHRDWIATARTERAEETATRLLAATDQALDRLIALVGSRNEPTALGASKFLIDSARSWHHELDLEARLEEIEARFRHGQ